MPTFLKAFVGTEVVEVACGDKHTVFVDSEVILDRFQVPLVSFSLLALARIVVGHVEVINGYNWVKVGMSFVTL